MNIFDFLHNPTPTWIIVIFFVIEGALRSVSIIRQMRGESNQAINERETTFIDNATKLVASMEVQTKLVIDSTESRIDTYQKTIATLENTIGILEKTVQDLQCQLDDCSDRIKLYRERIAELEARIKSLEEEIEILKKEKADGIV
jgi:peptidoglycan hydrolase CwlO-like protein